MENFIESIPSVCEDIIYQLINKNIDKEKISFEKQIELKDGISVITSITSRENLFQIMISFSEELAKNIASLIKGKVPVVIIDSQVKEIIMEISKLIISNSMIYLEDYDELCLPSPPWLIEAKDIVYSTGRSIITFRFKLMEEEFVIAIVTRDKRKGDLI